MTEMRITGLKEIAESFEKLPSNIGGPVLHSATMKAALPILFEMQRRAPYLQRGSGFSLERLRHIAKTGEKGEKHTPGALQASIRRFNIKQPFPDLQSGVGVGPKMWYARYIEYGTAHAPAHPFVGPAFDSAVEESITALQDEMGKAIDKALAKYGWS